MKVSFFEYLRTGFLGNIGPGVDRRAVHRELGTPLSALAQSADFWDAVQWGYSALCVRFTNDGKVDAFGMYVTGIKTDDKLSFEEWDGKTHFSEDWLLEQLRLRSISYERKEDNEGTSLVITEGKVAIEFVTARVTRILSPASEWSL
jgi:hypothetical protein